MIFNIKYSYLNKLIIFSVFLFIIKLIALPFVQEIDADGVSRVYLSLQFAENPHIIPAGNWPPIFFYIMGGALKLYHNQFVTPVIVNIFFSIFLLFPMFYLLKRQFGDKISFLLCVFFSFSPIIFRMSLLSMAEMPFLFFAIMSLNAIVNAYMDQKNSLALLAGLFMSIAGGIRYESWILGVLIIFILFFLREQKQAIFFMLSFLLIPIYWLLSNYFYSNEIFNSFNWAINLSEETSIKSVDSLLRRIWWYPLSLMFAFGPIAFFFFIKELKYIKESKVSLLLFLLFSIFFILWLANSLRGSLLLQHRFSIILFLFSFPFIGFYFKRYNYRIVSKTIVFSLSAFLLAFGYSSKGARPVPRLLTKEAQKVSKIINNNLTINSGFICDFWNWETTYYLPFATGLNQEKIVILDSNGQIQSVKIKVENILIQNNEGVILVNKKSELFKLLNNNTFNHLRPNNSTLELENIFEKDSIICYKYQVIQPNL